MAEWAYGLVLSLLAWGRDHYGHTPVGAKKTPGFLIFVFLTDGRFRPPSFWKLSWPPGAAQTPKIDDLRSRTPVRYFRSSFLGSVVRFRPPRPPTSFAGTPYPAQPSRALSHADKFLRYPGSVNNASGRFEGPRGAPAGRKSSISCVLGRKSTPGPPYIDRAPPGHQFAPKISPGGPF